ncbi:MAG: hypothetical protein CL674_14475 [Bdellovibrionaceae bacterium]|jgi:hypothetical protein|nr:hypothetical protein [Pseudobdellovibrionaceae bacterium]MAF92472.1 hypothetical protein [Pseudobdellovibrionaceae bacterium]QDP47564.1 MAG: hypothetical protein GOVbin1174_12 [Prokaryotic dsDNA virus sp.]|tara:strand:+ start:17278 stop:17763 length:486 start_codon:yes stop_codon:yes gene_type:complete
MSDLIGFNPSMIAFEGDYTAEEVENFILKFEEFTEALNLPRVEFETSHKFCNGVYAREIRIPKGTLITGKYHKHENLNILSKGKIISLSGLGREVLEAPHTGVYPPGKKMFLVQEDCVWTTLVKTDKTDLDEIDKEFIAEQIEVEKVEEIKSDKKHIGGEK